NYPDGPYPASGFYSWDHIISCYNQVTGEPAVWAPASSGLNQQIRANYFADYNSVNQLPPGRYPWPGLDCNSPNVWYWSSAPNNNHFKFGGVSQTSGAAYFSFLFLPHQGVALEQGTFDIIAGFTS